jgi:Family of unknown function (DUF5681)
MGKLDGLIPWKPGQSGNPGGRKKLRPELEQIAHQGRETAIESINKALLMTPDQLKHTLSNPNATMAEHLVASVLSKAIKEGCPIRAQFLMNYVLGKPAKHDPKKVFEENMERNDGALNPDEIPSSILIEVIQQHNTTTTSDKKA